jgi:hypothetical protein
MKSQFSTVVFVASALVCGLAFSQNPAAPDPSQSRIDKLEKDVAASRLRVEALSTEVADLKKELTATVTYLEEQSKAANSMASALDESEKAGFTYGINPDSRHILLKGWRDQLAAAQKDVPAPPAGAPAPVPHKAPPPVKADVKDAKPPVKAGT